MAKIKWHLHTKQIEKKNLNNDSDSDEDFFNIESKQIS